MKISLVLEFWADGDCSEKYQRECLEQLIEDMDSAGVSVKLLNMYILPED